MNRRLIINEEEKRRILNLHESRRSKELGLLSEDDSNWKKYPCVTSAPGVAPSKLSDGTLAYGLNGVFYYNNGRTKLKDGKMSSYYCNGNKIVIGNKPAQPKSGGGPSSSVSKKVTPPSDAPQDIKKFQQWVINTKGDKVSLGKGGDSGFGDDGRWGMNTSKAWQKYSAEYKTVDQKTETPAQPEKMAIKSTSDLKVQSTNAPTQLAGTNKQVAPVTKSPEVAADLKTASEIRQQFRQGKRDQRQIQRQYDKMYNTYNRLSDKMDKQTQDQYLNAMSALKQQLDQA